MGLFTTKQKSKEYADFQMSMIQSTITEAIFDSETTQTSVQTLNIGDVNCEGDVYIGDIDFNNTTTSTSVASSNVQQSATEDATMAQTMTESAEQVSKGLSIGSTTQSTSQYISESMQASQYTKSVTSTKCAIDQSNEQTANIGSVTGDDCTVTDFTFSNNTDSISQCTQIAVQTSSQSLEMTQTGSETSSQKAVGFSLMGVLILILIICLVLMYWVKGMVSTVYRVVIPWMLIGFGMMAILWGSGYDLAYMYPQSKSKVDVDYLNDNDDALDCSTDYSTMEANRVSLSPPLTYWFVTHQSPVYELMDSTASQKSIARIYTNRTMSTQYNSSSNLCDNTLGVTKYTSPFMGTGLSGITPDCLPTFQGCSSNSGGNGLRYIYTSYDFGGDEVTRCGKQDGDVSACTDADGAAGVIKSSDNIGRNYEIDGNTGKTAWRNVFASAAQQMVICNNWANDSGTGLLQNFAFGSHADGIIFSKVQSTLQRALPWFEHHVTNDGNSATNFNVAVFVSPYGSDARCSDSAWTNLGFAENTCQPHFWAIFCYRVGTEDTLDKCLLQLGGSDGETPDAVTKCEEDGECDDYKNTIAKTNWWGSEMSGMYGDAGPHVVQQSAGLAVSGKGYATSVGDQMQRTFDIANTQGGYFLPRCHSQVPSTASGCNPSDSIALSGKSDNVCCRPSNCGFERWAEDFYDSDFNIVGPMGKLNPACYAEGTVLCTTKNICSGTRGPLPLCSDVIPFGADNEELNELVRMDVASTFGVDGSDCAGDTYKADEYIFSKTSKGDFSKDKLSGPLLDFICNNGYITRSSVDDVDSCAVATMATDGLSQPNCYTGYTSSIDLASMDKAGYDTTTGLAGIPQNYYSAALSIIGDDNADTSVVVVENPSQRCATSEMIANISDYDPGTDFIPMFNVCGLAGVPGFENATWACNSSGGGAASDDSMFGSVTTFAEAAERMCGGDYTLGWGMAPHAYVFQKEDGGGVTKQPWVGYTPPGTSNHAAEVPLYAEDENGSITSLWAVCRCPPPCDEDTGDTTTPINVDAMMIPTMVMAWQSSVTATSTTDDGGDDSHTMSSSPQFYLTMGFAMILIGLVMTGFGSYILYDNSRQLNKN